MSAEPVTCARARCDAPPLEDLDVCEAHHREIVMGLDPCKAVDCEERVPFGSLWCREHAAMRADGALSVTGERLDVPAHGVPCRMPQCAGEALKRTVGKRPQGGWNDLCQRHYDEKRETHSRSLATARAALPREESVEPTPPRAKAHRPVDATGEPLPLPRMLRPPQEELRNEPPCEHVHRQVNGAGVVSCCECGTLLLEAEALDPPPVTNGRPVPPLPLDDPPAAPLPRSPFDLESTLEISAPSLTERVLDAYASAIADALAAWGAELTLGENRNSAGTLAEHAERLLNLAPGIRTAVELLAEQPVSAVPSAE